MTTPTVSVCIPTYNGAQYVERTIRSVLAQTFTDFELVVRDDGSTDDTLDVVQSIDDERVRIVAGRENAGAGANFGLAVAEATGAYVKLLCQDDVIYPECLERQVAALDADPGVVMVSCHRDIVDDDDRVVYRNRGWRKASGVYAGRRRGARHGARRHQPGGRALRGPRSGGRSSRPPAASTGATPT